MLLIGYDFQNDKIQQLFKIIKLFAMEIKNITKYDASGELSRKSSAHSRVVGLAGLNKYVLEFGCNTGETSAILKNNGCRVVGVEVNEAAAKIAEGACEKIIVGDVEKDEIWQKIKGEFDVIIFADILEHLVNPDRVLRKAKKYLKKNGFVIVSLPNVANWRVRFSLLFGKFNYAPTGILDDTHLRFYTLDSAKRLISDNYLIINIFPAATRVPQIFLNAFSRILATQWIFKCKQYDKKRLG